MKAKAGIENGEGEEISKRRKWRQLGIIAERPVAAKAVSRKAT
jgi:hypothetical protein